MLVAMVTRDAFAWSRCASCLNAWSGNLEIGGHAYGWVYGVPIGAVLTPQLIGIERSAHLPYASSLCGACRDVCPVKIDIPALLLHLRAQVIEQRAGKSRLLERVAFRCYTAVMTRPRLYEWTMRVARI